MPLVVWYVLVVLHLILALLAQPSCVQAANVFNSLNLNPKSTLLVILDNERKLTSNENLRLFEMAGFNVKNLNTCVGKDEFNCVMRSLKDIKKHAKYQDIIFMTSAVHSQSVQWLYSETRLRHYVSAVVMFRAQYSSSFIDDPPQTDLKPPPVLVIVKGGDVASVMVTARRFSDHMRSQGVWSWFFLLPEQMSQFFRPGGHDVIIKIISWFIGASETDDLFTQYLARHARWQWPPWSHDSYYDHPKFIATYHTSDHFKEAMKVRFRDEPEDLKQWSFETFKGFDVLAYRDHNAVNRGARYLILRNLGGNYLPIDLDVYGKYEPLIVIGIDYESNLFRIHPFLYRTKMKYSWVKGKRPEISVLPLGAFLHFQKPLPKALMLDFNLLSNLSFDSIAFEHMDPLISLDGLSATLKGLLTRTKGGCIFCHKLGSLGGRMHHIVAATARPQPGYALPLRSYSQDVLHNFLYDQKRVAGLFGVTPNFVPSAQARELLEFLTNKKRDASQLGD